MVSNKQFLDIKIYFFFYKSQFLGDFFLALLYILFKLLTKYSDLQMLMIPSEIYHQYLSEAILTYLKQLFLNL